MRDFERLNYANALEAAGWRITGADGAAALLGTRPSTLTSRLKALGVDRPAADLLYFRLGGRSHVEALCRDLFARVIADPLLGRFWAGRSDAGLRREERLVASTSSRFRKDPSATREQKSAPCMRRLASPTTTGRRSSSTSTPVAPRSASKPPRHVRYETTSTRCGL